MPIDPKRALRGIRQQEIAAQQKALSAKQQKRRVNQPDQAEAAPETEAAQWVRDNMEWDQSSEIWEVPYTTSGDYVGGYMQKANAKYLMATYPDLFTSVTGGYSSETVGITEEKRLALTDDEFNTVKEIVEDLEDYPSIDDDTTSEVESEARWEYWTEYGRDGVREELVKKFSDDFLAQVAVCLKTNDFWDAMFSQKEWDQYINQDGAGLTMYMRTKDVVDCGHSGVTVDEVMGDEAEVYAFLYQKFQQEELAAWVKILHENGVYLNSDEEALATWKEAERQIGVENLWKVDRPDMQKEPGGAIELAHKALQGAAKLIKSTPFDQVMRWAKTRPDDPNQLNFKLESKRIIEALLAEQEAYRLSTTQIDLPKPLADHVLKWGRINIKDDDLYYDEDGGCGRETEGHISVLYGLKEEKPSKALIKLVRDTKPFTIRLGRVSLFTTDEKFDVVKVSVDSDDLVALSDAIRQACPNENKFPKYVPHSTVAYVKKGRADKFKDSTLFTDDASVDPEFEATELLFKGAGGKDDPDRVIVSLAFNRTKNEAIDPKRVLLRHINSPLTRPTRLGAVRNGTVFQCGDGCMMRKVDGRTYLINPGGTETLHDIGNDQYLCYPTSWDKATMGSYGRNYSKRRHEAIDPKRRDESITIRPSNDAFDWNGLATTAGVNDEGDPFQCLAAFDNGKLVGSVIYQNTGDMLWIEHVYVLEQYRRKGIAEAILRRVIDENPHLPLEGGWRSEEIKALVRKLGGNVDGGDALPRSESAMDIIDAVDPKRVLRNVRASEPPVYPYGFKGDGSVTWLGLDGALSTTPVPFPMERAKKLRELPQWRGVRWTRKPLRAYWGSNVLEAIDPKRVLRQLQPKPVWYAYMPRRYGRTWLTLSGTGSELPVKFTEAEKQQRETLSHWAEVEWTNDPNVKFKRVTETQAPTPAEIEKAAAKTEPEPSAAQKEAGNYAKGHVDFYGLDISIENAKGSERSGKDKDGKEWKVTMPAVYGYVCGTEARDGDDVDVYIGENPDSQKVWVVNQKKIEGGFDEVKVMLGFANKFRAVRCYDRAFSGGLGPKLREEVIETTVGGFKRWLKQGETKKPFEQLKLIENLDKAKLTAQGIMARGRSKADRLKAKGWTKKDFAAVFTGGPEKQKEVGLSVRARAAAPEAAEEGLDEAIDPKHVLLHPPKNSITRPTYFKYIPDGWWFRSVQGDLIQKDESRDPDGTANAYVYSDEAVRQVALSPSEQCFSLRYVKESRFPFDHLNFPTDASVLVAKLLDLDRARPKPVL